MEKYSLNREETLLMIIDIQDRLVPVMGDKDQVIHYSKILLQAAEEMNFPVLVTEQYPKGLGRTVPELLELVGEEQIFVKNSFTACTDQVKEELVRQGRKKILIAGMETHVCVFQTARDLLAAGYQVFLASDAVTSRARFNYLNGLDLIQSMGAVITNTETAIFDLLKVSGTPEFKAMSALIK
ncbi:MAG: isochorismatase family protein [Clostridiaceae bacterium]|jgi:nicotinamidase-related amidase|nr:isochorismatase family protein [Clostridiaceae bacterium]